MKRILIVRTDRIGDVVLSTPVIKAVREALPGAFVAMLVSPYTRDIVDGNPYLNEVIALDKKKFKGLLGSARFSGVLRKKSFDTAIVLHPMVRIHIILWLAGIRNRVGLNKKWGFLLTRRIAHTKQLGGKHEADYNLDILRLVGIEPKGRELLVPVKEENRLKIKRILKENELEDGSGFVVVHPGASCPSKRWPSERFAMVADEIINRFHKKIVIIASTNNKDFSRKMREKTENAVLDLSGSLSVGELAALLEKSKLLISNDSGPVHIAVALGVPVVAIFGRNQPGLSSKRWGPIGKNDIVLHKDVGCIECLAHNCALGFKCLTAIEPNKVVEAAGKLLK